MTRMFSPEAIRARRPSGTCRIKLVLLLGASLLAPGIPLADSTPSPPRLIGQSAPPREILYYHTDHLGTPVMVTDAYNQVLSRHKYLPFGEELPAGPPANTHTRRFTGHERDAESGLDYMMARYYTSQAGRFLSVDPGDDTDPLLPQSWSKYAYTRNNPVKYVDPDGEAVETPVDIAMAGISICQAIKDPSFGNIAGAVLDVLAAATPFVPAVAGRAIDAGQAANKLIDAGKAGGNIVENAAKGKAAEQAVASELKAEGKTILGSQVTANTSEGARRIDHLVESGGTVGAVEFKSGNATRSASQVTKDNAMASQGATLVGKNTPDSLKGKSVKIETEVRRPKESQ